MFKKIMLTVLVLAAFSLLIVVKSNAAPCIICSPQAGVTGYEITGIQGELVSFIAQPDGSLKYCELASIPNGSYSGTIRPCNMWGCGPATAIPPFVKAVPVAAVGVALVPK